MFVERSLKRVVLDLCQRKNIYTSILRWIETRNGEFYRLIDDVLVSISHESLEEYVTKKIRLIDNEIEKTKLFCSKNIYAGSC